MTKRALVVLATLLLAVSGCKKVKNMAKYKDRATALAAKYAPKVAELTKKLPDLAAHAKDLPVNVPGADKLGTLLADNKDKLAQASDILAKLPGQIATDKPEDAEKALDDADKALAADVAAAEQDEKVEADIEAAAAATPPPPAPTGSGSGSAAPAGSAGPSAGGGAM